MTPPHLPAAPIEDLVFVSHDSFDDSSLLVLGGQAEDEPAVLSLLPMPNLHQVFHLDCGHLRRCQWSPPEMSPGTRQSGGFVWLQFSCSIQAAIPMCAGEWAICRPILKNHVNLYFAKWLDSIR